MDKYIYKSNLELALYLAILYQENSGNSNSCLTVGFREVLKDLKDGKQLEIRG